MNEKVKTARSTTVKIIARFAITPLLMIAIFHATSGRLDWWEMWAYIANFFVVVVLGRLILLIKRPDHARERMEAGGKEDTKPWDKRLVPLIALYIPFASMAIAGLDRRFEWSGDLPDWAQLIALGFLFGGGMFANWAMIANRFFSSHVRIQTERGHHVIDKGPYRIMRHPGYAGGLLSWLAAPVFFSSWAMLLPCLLSIGLTFYRTALEDETLQEELPGYREYAARVKYRLIPGVW